MFLKDDSVVKNRKDKENEERSVRLLQSGTDFQGKWEGLGQC